MPAAAIVGGTETTRLAAETVMVLSDRGGVCSGIVVAQDAVLTAAHCGASAPTLRIHWRERGEPILVEPRRVARHPSYVAGAVEARRASVDLMLVQLREPLPDRFRPARLDAGPTPRKDEGVTILGYGATRGGEARSTGSLRSANLSVVEPYGPGRILVWASRSGAGACLGDSGGPMVRAGSETVFALIAFASGEGRDSCGALTQAVLLAPQRAWIDRTLATWGGAARWQEP